jgi:3',5'-cyclic AMP phosphodiesterase CpdA
LTVFAADEIVGGPYVVNATGKTATIGWVVKPGDVKIGGSPDKLERSVPAMRSEKVSFTNLIPGTKVYYDVLGGKPEGKGYFKTPAAEGASFDFVVFGDTRTRHELHQKIVDAIDKLEPDFVLHTGDLVIDGYDSAQWPIFFNIERNLLRKTAFYPVLGNHERNNRRFHEFFDITTPYYSYNWGSAHFVVLNSDLGNVALSATAKDNFWAEQQRWLEDDLAKASKSEFRFVTLHHPPFTAVKSRQAENKPVLALVPIFEKYKVNAVFAGHDHNYQRHVNNGITYIITGGGGAPLYPVDAPINEITKKVESVEHYVKMKVVPGKATLTAVALDGHIIESIDLKP